MKGKRKGRNGNLSSYMLAAVMFLLGSLLFPWQKHFFKTP